jgi:hypothetical protein
MQEARMGYVEVQGTVDLKQFWPHGGSDADTVKFIPDLTTAFWVNGLTRIAVGDQFKIGGVYLKEDDDPRIEKFKAIMKGSSKEYFTVRLQGIDAPELHYFPNFRDDDFDGVWSTWIDKKIWARQSFRQPYAKLCTDFLINDARRILDLDKPTTESMPVKAKLVADGDSIHAVIDPYRRVIGKVELINDSASVVINDLALKQGFAFCSFYSSMTLTEIDRLFSLFKTHADGKTKSTLVRNMSKRLHHFEASLWTSASAADDDRDDNNSDVFPQKCFDPKIFRRCVDWIGLRQVYPTTPPLLRHMQGSDEQVVLIGDFRAANGDWDAATKRTLGSLIKDDGSLDYDAGTIVFKANQAKIVDKDRNPLPAHF